MDTDWREIISKAKSIDKSTNSVRSAASQIAAIEAGESELYNNGILWVAKPKNGYALIEYYVDDVLVGQNNDCQLPNELINRYECLYADMTTQGNEEERLPILERAGMTWYRTYVRKTAKNGEKTYQEPICVETSKEDDIEEIQEMLYASFDPMADHLPTENELNKLLSGGSAFCVHMEDHIGGVLLFEDTGARSYLRVLCVAKPYRGNRIGHALMAHYHNTHKEFTKMYTLWMDRENRAAEALYRNFGYISDGLYNIIYRWQREDPIAIQINKETSDKT